MTDPITVVNLRSAGRDVHKMEGSYPEDGATASKRSQPPHLSGLPSGVQRVTFRRSGRQYSSQKGFPCESIVHSGHSQVRILGETHPFIITRCGFTTPRRVPSAHRLCSGLASEPDSPAYGLPAIVREAQEIECLRAAHLSWPAVHFREPDQLDEPGLGRMQG